MFRSRRILRQVQEAIAYADRAVNQHGVDKATAYHILINKLKEIN